MSLSADVARFCHAHRLGLNRDLGQHFLVDERVLAEIVEAAELRPDDLVVEIGPGIGVLTKELLARAARVLAVEVDARMLPILAMYTATDGSPHPNLEIVRANALSIALPSEPYKIVANIPYHITSPLLRHAFLESARPPTSLTLLIQREVAEKICDPRDAGLLTVIVGLFGTPRLVTRVGKAAFLPPPAVESAVLHVDCFPSPRAEGDVLQAVLRLAKIGFGQKRKILSNTLGNHAEGLHALAVTGIDPKRRPQTLSVDEWIALAAASLSAPAQEAPAR